MTIFDAHQGFSIPFEEEYLGYLIFIDKNPDTYRGGLIWEISKENEILETDIEFSQEFALKSATEAVDRLHLAESQSVPYS